MLPSGATRPLGVALVLLGLLLACTDDAPPPTVDLSPAKDASRDGPAPDQSTSDAAPDRAVADQRGPDRAVADQRGPDRAVADQRPPTPDQAAGCAGITCTVVNDCCLCRAFNLATTPPPKCGIPSCKQPTCGALGIKSPTPYCLKGRCFVTDGPTSCTNDTDCQLVNNCCDCLALPAKASAPSCNITSCLVSTCTSVGLPTARARCIGGSCRLVP